MFAPSSLVSARTSWSEPVVSVDASEEEELIQSVAREVEVTRRLRELSPLYEMAQEGIDLKSVTWKHA
jgi:hypothetical protein